MNIESVSMREIELESAELLPTRETLCCPRPCNPCGPVIVGIDVNIGVIAVL